MLLSRVIIAPTHIFIRYPLRARRPLPAATMRVPGQEPLCLAALTCLQPLAAAMTDTGALPDGPVHLVNEDIAKICNVVITIIDL